MIPKRHEIPQINWFQICLTVSRKNRGSLYHRKPLPPPVLMVEPLSSPVQQWLFFEIPHNQQPQPLCLPLVQKGSKFFLLAQRHRNEQVPRHRNIKAFNLLYIYSVSQLFSSTENQFGLGVRTYCIDPKRSARDVIRFQAL